MSVDRCSHSVAYRFDEGYRCSRCDEPVAARWSSNERWVYRAGLLLSIFFWVGLALGAVEWLGLGAVLESGLKGAVLGTGLLAGVKLWR